MATLNGGVLGVGAPAEVTRDALFDGSLVLFQPRRGTGYRTNVDALLLASFAVVEAVRSPRVVFDLGSGVGPVGLALLRRDEATRVVFVEIDDVAANIARRNLDANGWTERGEVIRADVLDVARTRQGEADLVVCNPPYVAPGRGRVRTGEERARVGDVGAFVTAARQVAGQRARVCFIYPAQELTALFASLVEEGLHPKRARFVHATAGAPARVVLVEAQAARPGGLIVAPPLVERDEGGDYTSEMRALLLRGSSGESGANRKNGSSGENGANGGSGPRAARADQRRPSSRSRAMAHAARTLR